MSTSVLLMLFFASLAVSVVSSMVLVTAVDRVGVRLDFSEPLLGIVTALAADAPEISAAVTAISRGTSDLGLGVVLGSSIFNIAALLGLSAAIAGGVVIRPRGLVFNAVTATLVATVAMLLVLGVIGAVASILSMVAVVVPYVALASQRPEQLERRLPAGGARRFLSLALAEEERDVRPGEQSPPAERQDGLTLVPALVAVVVASIELVGSATTLAHRWGVSDAILGNLVLAVLTGIPNVIGAVRLARRRRGSAVVSEALNSNTFNLLAGLVVPALLVGLGAVSRIGLVSAVWLLGMTVLAAGLTYFRGSLRRAEGIVVIVSYLIFCGLVISS